MNAAGFLSLVPRRGVLAAVIFLAAGSVWLPKQRAISQIERRLTQAKTRQDALEKRIAAATQARDSLRSEVHEERAKASRLRADARIAEQQLAQLNPDALWAEPPAAWPEWNNDSPFVWVRKDILARVAFPAFTKEGGLRHEASAVLGLDESSQGALNADLEHVLSDYRKIELDHAQQSDEHLPNVASEPGPKVTVRIPSMPEEGKRFQEQFQTTLRQYLGQQRSELLEDVGASWIDAEFSAFGAEPKIVSASRRPDGSLTFSIESGKSTRMSVGGPAQLDRYVPPHLLPFFTAVLDQGVDGKF